MRSGSPAGRRPLIVGIGGTTRATSSTERALAVALAAAEAKGAETRLFGGVTLAALPHYAPDDPVRSAEQSGLVEAVRVCDGLIIASPGYHGSVSAVVKNALDLLEDLAKAEPPYWDGRAVGLIACGYGWQATGSTLATLRAITHAMRGWPTPFGAALNTSVPLFDADGACLDATVQGQLNLVGEQVMKFALGFEGF